MFFEHFFTPHEVVHQSASGFVTGYYEPIVEGSRDRTARFNVPLYRRPPDLENIVPDAERARPDVPYTHMRRGPAGLEPYATRAEIEAGALAGKGLELMWLADPVDAFFAQVQGSLRVRLPDGTLVALTYDGKNGHPYSSVGKLVIDRGEIGSEDMTLDRLGAWLRADPERGRKAMQHNASFVFFREADGVLAGYAQGALGTALVPGRSLAVDTAFHSLGTPIYIDAPHLRHWGKHAPFRRLMVAHDVGSAIRGPERGDIYFGSGAEAGQRAGMTKHRAKFYVLLPRGPSP
jgi:membrane-bound lytic murein transglycosylase A